MSLQHSLVITQMVKGSEVRLTDSAAEGVGLRPSTVLPQGKKEPEWLHQSWAARGFPEELAPLPGLFPRRDGRASSLPGLPPSGRRRWSVNLTWGPAGWRDSALQASAEGSSYLAWGPRPFLLESPHVCIASAMAPLVCRGLSCSPDFAEGVGRCGHRCERMCDVNPCRRSGPCTCMTTNS